MKIADTLNYHISNQQKGYLVYKYSIDYIFNTLTKKKILSDTFTKNPLDITNIRKVS